MQKKLRLKDYSVIASMIFALFFGAGNLIFPLQLGQQAGSHWLPAVIGFLTTGVLLPLFSVLAVAVSRAQGLFDLLRPLGKRAALIGVVVVQATVGPLFATPRTATVAYTTGFAPLLPAHWQTVGLLLFSLLFFAAAFYLAYQPNQIIARLGKWLNPLFLILLAVVFGVAFWRPLGSLASGHAYGTYAHQPYLAGFLAGYNTMDALAGLVFGIAIVIAIKDLGISTPKQIAHTTIYSGSLAMAAVGVIYFLLVMLGAMSVGHFAPAADGGSAFAQIVTYYAGWLGQVVLAALLLLACLTTAAGLIAAFAQDFAHHFGKLSYHQWLAVCCVVSFGLANLGLDQLLVWSKPVLVLLYPLAVGVIVLALFGAYFDYDRSIYTWTLGATGVTAILAMITAFPPVISASWLGRWAQAVQASLPLSQWGFAWVFAAAVGFGCGWLHWWVRRRQGRIVPKKSLEN